MKKKPSEKKGGGTEVSLTYLIKEGDLFTFDSISIEGNTIFTTEELLSLFPLKKDDKMDLTRFQRGYDRLRLKYADQGFIFNNFDYKEIRDPNKNSVSFLINIEELGQGHIENIIINGNVRTKDYVIYRALGIHEGDVFSSSALNFARLNLLGTRYFSDVVPNSAPGSAPGLIDLIFNLEEAMTRDIRFGATFGGTSEFPVSLYLTWIQNNLAGRGLILSTTGTASPIDQSVSVSFTDPYFFQSPFSFFTSLNFSHQKFSNVPQDLTPPLFDGGSEGINYDDYTGHYVFTTTTDYNGITYSAGDPFPGRPSSDDIQTYNLVKDSVYYGGYVNSVYNHSLMEYDSFRIGYNVGSGYVYRTPWGKLGTTVTIGPDFNFVLYDHTIYRPADIQVRQNLNNWKIYNILSLKGYYDGRDISYSPTKGAYVSQLFNFYGGILFGDAHFIKSTSVVEGHVPLVNLPVFENWSWKLVLSAQSVFSAILPQWYYPDGTSYEADGPSYAQKLDLNGIFNSRGWARIRNGEATWNTWIELRMPLFERVLWWDQFLEGARLWNDLDDVGVAEKISDYRFTMGTGFRFVLQQFPIRIYIGKRFRFDDEWNVIWQRGNLAGSDAGDDGGVDLIFTLGIDYF